NHIAMSASERACRDHRRRPARVRAASGSALPSVPATMHLSNDHGQSEAGARRTYSAPTTPPRLQAGAGPTRTEPSTPESGSAADDLPESIGHIGHGLLGGLLLAHGGAEVRLQGVCRHLAVVGRDRTRL